MKSTKVQTIDKLRRRVSFSNTIALIALFVSLGGSVYAATKIDGRQIKQASIPGSKLKPNTVRGAHVNERSLGRVPTARSADTARTLAGNEPGAFVSSGDVKRIRFDATRTETQTPVTQNVLQIGPLQLEAECDPGDFPAAVGTFKLRASTSAPNAGFDIGFVRNTGAPGSGGGFLGATPTDVLAEAAANDFRRLVGNFIYNDQTTTVTVPFVLFLDDSVNSETRCFFTGTATSATG